MTIRVLRAADLPRVPWKNGQGQTREIARSPGVGPWSWRVSLAESDRTASFSTFPGIERELVLLHGAGLTLRFDDGDVAHLHEPLARFRFTGKRRLTGEPHNGRTEQLNLMWRASLVSTDVVAPIGPRTTLDTGAGQWWVVHVRDGTARVDGDSEAIGPGDSVVLSPGRSAEQVRLAVTGSVLAVRICPAE